MIHTIESTAGLQGNEGTLFAQTVFTLETGRHGQVISYTADIVETTDESGDPIDWQQVVQEFGDGHREWRKQTVAKFEKENMAAVEQAAMDDAMLAEDDGSVYETPEHQIRHELAAFGMV